MRLFELLAIPTAVRGILYVVIVIGSGIVFATSMGLVGSEFEQFVLASVSSESKTPAARVNVPLPELIVPTAPAEAVQPTGESVPPESSIQTLAAADESGGSITEVAPPSPLGRYRVISDVTIRAQSSKNSAALGAIGAGELVSVVAEQNGWLQISQDGAVLGWVYQRFLQREND